MILPEIKQQIIAERKNGAEFKELQAKYNISINTIFKWCKGIGSRRRVPEEVKKQIRHVYTTENVMRTEIAKRFDVSVSEIDSVCVGLCKYGKTRKQRTGTYYNAESLLEKLAIKKSKLEKLKNDIIPGQTLILEYKGKRIYDKSITVKEKTESFLSGRNEKGRIENILWCDFLCGAVRLKKVS